MHTAVELSYQARESDGLDFATSRQLTPHVFRASILPIISPKGRGTYSRPQIYAVYTVSVLNQDAAAIPLPARGRALRERGRALPGSGC